MIARSDKCIVDQMLLPLKPYFLLNNLAAEAEGYSTLFRKKQGILRIRLPNVRESIRSLR